MSGIVLPPLLGPCDCKCRKGQNWREMTQLLKQTAHNSFFVNQFATSCIAVCEAQHFIRLSDAKTQWCMEHLTNVPSTSHISWFWSIVSRCVIAHAPKKGSTLKHQLDTLPVDFIVPPGTNDAFWGCSISVKLHFQDRNYLPLSTCSQFSVLTTSFMRDCHFLEAKISSSCVLV